MLYPQDRELVPTVHWAGRALGPICMDPDNLFLSGFQNPDCTACKVIAVPTGTSWRPFVQLQRCKMNRIYGDKGRTFSAGRAGKYMEEQTRLYISRYPRMCL